MKKRKHMQKSIKLLFEALVSDVHQVIEVQKVFGLLEQHK